MSKETITKQQIVLIGFIILMLIVAIYFLMRLLKNLSMEYFDITGVNNSLIKIRSTNFNKSDTHGAVKPRACHNNYVNNETKCNKNVNNETKCNKDVYESKNDDNRKKKNCRNPIYIHKDIECNKAGDKENKLAKVRNNENSAYISYKEAESKRFADKAYTVNCPNSLDTQRNIKTEILECFNYEDEFTKTNTTTMEQHNLSINSFSGVKEGISEKKILLQVDDGIKVPL